MRIEFQRTELHIVVNGYAAILINIDVADCTAGVSSQRSVDRSIACCRSIHNFHFTAAVHGNTAGGLTVIKSSGIAGIDNSTCNAYNIIIEAYRCTGVLRKNGKTVDIGKTCGSNEIKLRSGMYRYGTAFQQLNIVGCTLIVYDHITAAGDRNIGCSLTGINSTGFIGADYYIRNTYRAVVERDGGYQIKPVNFSLAGSGNSIKLRTGMYRYGSAFQQLNIVGCTLIVYDHITAAGDRNIGCSLTGINSTGFIGADYYIRNTYRAVVERDGGYQIKPVNFSLTGSGNSIKQRTFLNCYSAADSGGAFETSAGFNDQVAIVAKSNI